MNFLLAQSIALVTYGNAYLQGKYAGQFSDENIFKSGGKISFLSELMPCGELPHVIETPQVWLHELKNAGVQWLKLHHAPSDPDDPDKLPVHDYQAVAFVNSGPSWLIEARSPEGSSLWQGIISEDASGNSEVKYVTLAYEKNQFDDFSDPLADLLPQFEETLSTLEAYAVSQSQETYAGYFKSAREVLRAETWIENNDRIKLIPDDFGSADAVRVLLACESAWVFGGMGSWNDLALDDDDYEFLTNKLFISVCNAAVAAANDSIPDEFKNQFDPDSADVNGMFMPVAHAIALTMFGNAFLQGKLKGPFPEEEEVFKFCGMKFLQPNVHDKDAPGAMSVQQWCEFLKSKKVQSLEFTMERGDEQFRVEENIMPSIRPGIFARISDDLCFLFMPLWKYTSDEDKWEVFYLCAEIDAGAPIPEQKFTYYELASELTRIASMLFQLASFAQEEALALEMNSLCGALAGRNLGDAEFIPLYPSGFISEEEAFFLNVLQYVWAFDLDSPWPQLAFPTQEIADQANVTYNELFVSMSLVLPYIVNPAYRAD